MAGKFLPDRSISRYWLSYIVGLALVAILIYIQQMLSFRLAGPRLGWMSPSALGVAVVGMLGSLLIVRLTGQRAAAARKHVVMLYVMIAVGIPLGTLGGAAALTGNIGRYPFLCGNPASGGEDRYYAYYEHLPLELWPGLYGSPEVMQFSGGRADAVPWSSWRKPLILWNVLFGGLTLCTVGLGILLRRQWLETESLPCPLNEVPSWLLNLDLDRRRSGEEHTGSLPRLRCHSLWIGFAIPMVIFLNNGLAHYFPHIFDPLVLATDLGRLLTEEPLSAMKNASGGPVPFPPPGLQLTVIPALVAVAFFLPKEITFSIVFFYMVGRVLMVIGNAVEVKWGIVPGSNASFMHYLHGDRIPYLYSIGLGAFFFITVGRSLQFLYTSIVRRQHRAQTAWGGLLLVATGATAAIWWLCWFGQPLYLAVIAVVGTMAMAVGLSRMRVEGGIPILFGIPPLMVVFSALALLPFTHSYKVVPGSENTAMPHLTAEAEAAYHGWLISSGDSGEADPPGSAAGAMPITAQAYCAFLNDGQHDKFWNRDDHAAVVHRRAQVYRNAAGFGVLALLSYVAILAVPALMVEGFQLGDRVQLARRHLIGAAVAAILVAVVVGEWVSLRHYYDVGVETLAAKGGGRITLLARTWELNFPYNSMNRWAGLQLEPDWMRTRAMGGGFIVAGILTVVRNIYCSFPLSAIGFAAALLVGGWCWGSVLIGYMVKATVLRFGGVPLYHRAKPFFVGLFCGHVAALVLWAAVAMLHGGEGNGFGSHVEPGFGEYAEF